jgi:sugar phosphate isomerase/epimerase
MHIHDNNGEKDSHSAIGDGNIDFGDVMAALQYNHAIPVLEVATYEGVVRSIAALEQL